MAVRICVLICRLWGMCLGGDYERFLCQLTGIRQVTLVLLSRARITDIYVV
jgi:hypothetical protein